MCLLCIFVAEIGSHQTRPVEQIPPQRFVVWRRGGDEVVVHAAGGQHATPLIDVGFHFRFVVGADVFAVDPHLPTRLAVDKHRFGKVRQLEFVGVERVEDDDFVATVQESAQRGEHGVLVFFEVGEDQQQAIAFGKAGGGV